MMFVNLFFSSNMGFLPIFLINGEGFYTGGEGYKLCSFRTVLNSLSGKKCKHNRKHILKKVRMYRDI